MPRRNIAAIATVAVILLATITGYRLGVFESASPQSVDFSFEGYQFGNPETVIDLGIQPLWLPGVISEVMRRDSILHEALAKRGFEIRFHAFLKGADVNSFIASRHLEAGIGEYIPIQE